MPQFIDLTGKRFGRWTVLKRAEDTWYKHPQFLCRCECGSEKVVKGQILRSGRSKSCGCYNKDVHREVCINRNTTHGLARTRTHNIWVGITQRCKNKNVPNYRSYGGRGIKVCDRWLSFENFLADMGECPSGKHTVDRIDNDGNYEPSNCRWASMKEQQNNRSNNRRIAYNGETLTLQQWCNRYGLDHKTLLYRIRKGWAIEKALTTRPIDGRNQYSTPSSRRC